MGGARLWPPSTLSGVNMIRELYRQMSATMIVCGVQVMLAEDISYVNTFGLNNLTIKLQASADFKLK